MKKCSKKIWTVTWKKNLTWRAGISFHYFEPISLPMWANMPRHVYLCEYIKHNVPNKAGTLKLPKYYVQRLEYTWA